MSNRRPVRRILMTADTLGGVWTHAIELARGLGPHGVEIVLATQGELPDAAQRADACNIASLRLLTSPLRLEWMDDPWEDVYWSGRWLLEIEQRFRPDIVHLNGYAHGALPFDAPVVVGAHSCVLSWWEAVKHESAPARYDRYRDAVREGIAGADAVVAPTRWMLDAASRHYGPVRNGHVIPNGRGGLRSTAGPRTDTVVACGRLWDEAKNLTAVDAAASRIAWPVHVIGRLRHPAGGERPPANAVALGPLPPPDVARHMARSRICVHPARYEPFGLVPLEAALAGCALVLGDIPSLRETWGETALYIDPDDVDALAAAVNSLIHDPCLRETMASAARHRAVRFSPAAMADAYLALYRSVAAGPLTVSAR